MGEGKPQPRSRGLMHERATESRFVRSWLNKRVYFGVGNEFR